MSTWCLFGRAQDSARRTQPVKRVPAVADLPPGAVGAPTAPSDAAATAAAAAAAAAPTLVVANDPIVRGGLKSVPSSSQGTMFGQFYSPFLTTQEVLKRRAPKP